MKCLFPFVATLTAAVVGQAAEPDSDRGKALFEQAGCWECHGYSGQGGSGPMSGPRIARTALPLVSFVAVLRSPVRLMPPYGEALLTDQQIAELYAFLQSRPKPQPVSEISLLKEAAP